MSLVTLKELVQFTKSKKCGVGMFNVVNLEYAAAIVEAAEEVNFPVMLGMPERFFQFYSLETMSKVCVDLAQRAKVPVAVHLDHGRTFEGAMKALRHGFSSIMFDGSALSYEENVEKTAEIVKIAHAMGASVEGELGYVGRSGVDTIDRSLFTKPEQAVDFVERTGVDALAIAVGNIHGVYKGKPELDFERIGDIRNKIEAGLVLHGGSGLSEEDFKQAVRIGIDKVNIYTEISVLGAEHILAELPKAPSYLDVTKSLRLALKEFIKERILLFSVGEKYDA